MVDKLLTQNNKLMIRNGKLVIADEQTNLEECCCICCNEIFDKPIQGSINIFSYKEKVFPSRKAQEILNLNDITRCRCASFGIGTSRQIDWEYDEDTCIFEAPITDWCTPNFALQITCSETPDDACPNKDESGKCDTHFKLRVVRSSQPGPWLSPAKSQCSCCTCPCADWDLTEFTIDDLEHCCDPILPYTDKTDLRMIFSMHGVNDGETCTKRCGCNPCNGKSVVNTVYWNLGSNYLDEDDPFNLYPTGKTVCAAGPGFSPAPFLDCSICYQNAASYTLEQCGFYKPPVAGQRCFHVGQIVMNGLWNSCDGLIDNYEWNDWEGVPGQPFQESGCRYANSGGISQTCNANGNFTVTIGPICFTGRAAWAGEDLCNGCPECYTIEVSGGPEVLSTMSVNYMDPILDEEGEDFPMEIFDWRSMVEDENEESE